MNKRRRFKAKARRDDALTARLIAEQCDLPVGEQLMVARGLADLRAGRVVRLSAWHSRPVSAYRDDRQR
jgi:hypothetical protein